MRYEYWLARLGRLAEVAIRRAVRSAWEAAAGDIEVFERLLARDVAPLVAEFRRLAWWLAILNARDEAVDHGMVLDYLPGVAAYPPRVFAGVLRRTLRVVVDGDGDRRIVQPYRVLEKNLVNRLVGQVRSTAHHTTARLSSDSSELVALTRVVDAEVDRDVADVEDEDALARGRLSPQEREAARMRRDIRAQKDEAERLWSTGVFGADESSRRDYLRAREELARIEEKIRAREDYDAETARRLREGRPRAWARVLRGAVNCGFCVMLATRGPVYRSHVDAGGVRAYHDGCDCLIVPVYDHRSWPGREAYLRLGRVWQDFRDQVRDSDEWTLCGRDFSTYLATERVGKQMARVMEGLDPFEDRWGALEIDKKEPQQLLVKYLDEYSPAERFRHKRARRVRENDRWRGWEEIPKSLAPRDWSKAWDEETGEGRWEHFSAKERRIARRLEDEVGLPVTGLRDEGATASKVVRSVMSAYQSSLHGSSQGKKTPDAVDAFAVPLEFKTAAKLDGVAALLEKAVIQSGHVVVEVTDPKAGDDAHFNERMHEWVTDLDAKMALLVVLRPGGKAVWWDGRA